MAILAAFQPGAPLCPPACTAITVWLFVNPAKMATGQVIALAAF